MLCLHELPDICLVLGEDEELRIDLTGDGVSDLSTATATVTIKTMAGASVLAATAMTGDDEETERVFTYVLTTGSGGTITTAGHYRATYIVSFGTRTIQKYQDIVVEAVPTYGLVEVEATVGMA